MKKKIEELIEQTKKKILFWSIDSDFEKSIDYRVDNEVWDNHEKFKEYLDSINYTTNNAERYKQHLHLEYAMNELDIISLDEKMQAFFYIYEWPFPFIEEEDGTIELDYEDNDACDIINKLEEEVGLEFRYDESALTYAKRRALGLICYLHISNIKIVLL